MINNIQSNQKKSILVRILFLPFRVIMRLWKSPVPLGLWLVNKLFQKVLRLNSEVPWMVHFTSRVTGDITIGENVWISFAVSGHYYIQGINGVVIGDGSIFAPGVKIISANHELSDLKVWIKTNPIIIGKRCWIGANAIILPSVELGDNVVVAAGSVVTQSFPENSVIAGVPAKLIKKLQ